MRIAVFGLGIIGSEWAAHFQRDGHEVRAWNRSPRPTIPGATDDADAAAHGADLIAIVVSDPPAVRETLDRILPHLGPGTVLAQHSTIGVDDTLTCAARVQATGATFVDMPFTGSKPAAQQRQMVFFLGSADPLPEPVRAVYAAIAKTILPIGGIGSATAIKLCMNLLIANQYQALAEAFETAGRAGIPPDTFFKVLEHNIARSGVSDLKKDKLLCSDYRPQFSIKHMHKDLRLVLALAAAHGLSLPQTATVRSSYARAEEAGMGEADFAAMVETLRAPSG
jgi:3-hydroxyisobutyrate dehydrogenase-like beta-hydroxyacid dehydrogenase